MRVARVLLFLALSGAVAHADDAKPADPHPADAAPARAKVPLRVVRMLPETNQALLFDKTKGTHVVVEAGQTIEGYYVDSLDDDEVMLLSENGATVVLAAPDPAWRHHRDGADRDGADGKADAGRATKITSRAPTSAPASTAKPGEPQPADPYADLAASPEIGTGTDGVRVVEAPDAPAMAPTSAPAMAPTSAPAIGTGADGVRVVEAPDAPATPTAVPAPAPVTATPPTPVTATPPAPVTATPPTPVTAPAPVPVTATAPAPVTAAPTTAPPRDPAGDALAAALTGAPAPSTAAAPAADGPIVLARADVNAALASFGTLAGSIRGAFTPTGVRVDSVAPGSLFAKAGLKAGDLVSSVDGVPMTSLDNAADLYARAGTAKSVSVNVQRGGKPIVLRVAIQ